MLECLVVLYVYTHIRDRNCEKLDKKAQKLRFIAINWLYWNSQQLLRKFRMKNSISVIFVMMSSSMKMTLGRAQMLMN